MSRSILHCDMNNFYASVECMLDPSLRKYPVAVCGSVEERHGIVLAKNYAAKAFGVKTGDAVWQAKQKCKDLVVVPPHYEEYIKYSKLARNVYSRYTDQVEPYGMDECWLDISGTEHIFGSPEKVANEIREMIKFELGLTISVGVSFNKIFAKLGSDMKKPDAVTVIPQVTFREKIWGLPAADLLGVGRATQRVLDSYSIKTIGDLAKTDPDFLKRNIDGFHDEHIEIDEVIAPLIRELNIKGYKTKFCCSGHPFYSLCEAMVDSEETAKAFVGLIGTERTENPRVPVRAL